MNNGKVCVSVCAESADEMIAKIRRAQSDADMIEVRFDCLDPADVAKVVGTLPKVDSTYIFTLRPKHQGGTREIELSERLGFWESIFYRHTKDFIIDIEAEPEIVMAVTTNDIPRIISNHNFDGVVTDTDRVFDALEVFETDIYKLAAMAEDATDAIPVWKCLEKAIADDRLLIPIGMGEAGKWTRILGPAHGAYMTYASLDEGEETAAGQITAQDLINVYRVRELDTNTRVYGIIGDPVSSSISPIMQNAAFAHAGMNAVFVPLLVKDIDEFMRRMVKPETREVELNFDGFCVTMPHKLSIMKHLDKTDATAAKIGAVNTIKITDDKLVGYNTDAHGFITPLKTRFGDLKNARVAVLGAGGAARACVYALKQEGAEVTVCARDLQKAAIFKEEFDVNIEQQPTANGQLPTDTDILVNATPVGMKDKLEDDTLFNAEQLLGVKFVYDLVARPMTTALVREAKKAGIPAIGGVEMFIAQGVRQFEIWTGRDAPEAIMRQAVMTRLNKLI